MELNCFCHFVIVFVGVLVFQSISASETPCSLHSGRLTCPDPNEACSEQTLHSGRLACPDPNEACSEQSDDNGVCKCKPGYSKQHPKTPCIQIRRNTPTDLHPKDQPTTPEAEYSSKVSGSTIAASILIPLVLIVAVVGLVFAARRYHWLHRLQHLRQQHYDEVRIGQEDDDDDDPPIA